MPNRDQVIVRIEELQQELDVLQKWLVTNDKFVAYRNEVLAGTLYSLEETKFGPNITDCFVCHFEDLIEMITKYELDVDKIRVAFLYKQYPLNVDKEEEWFSVVGHWRTLDEALCEYSEEYTRDKKFEDFTAKATPAQLCQLAEEMYFPYIEEEDEFAKDYCHIADVKVMTYPEMDIYLRNGKCNVSYISFYDTLRFYKEEVDDSFDPWDLSEDALIVFGLTVFEDIDMLEEEIFDIYGVFKKGIKELLEEKEDQLRATFNKDPQRWMGMITTEVEERF